MGVWKSSLQTWHWSADSSEDNDARGVPIQSVGSDTTSFESIFKRNEEDGSLSVDGWGTRVILATV